jgi:CheY-like chemotaxis protein
MTRLSTRAPSAPSSTPPGLCFLLVEDDAADAYLIGRALSEIGRVVHARSGAEALAMVDRGEVTPDLAFIDLHMPIMSGFDVLVAFASRGAASFPMVVLTSSSSPRDATPSRLGGAVRVVTKPDTVAEMSAVLRMTVDAVCCSGAAAAGQTPSLGASAPGRSGGA